MPNPTPAMKKIILILIIILTCTGLLVRAQEMMPARSGPAGGNSPAQPFLFSVNTLTGNAPFWNLQYSGSYGERIAGQFGYDGVNQQVSVKGYLGNRFTLYANAALGFSRGGGMASAQQAELMRDLIGGRQAFGPRFGISLGASRDWSSTGAIFSRITGSFDAASWQLIGNARFEKAFANNRDGIDLITSIGYHHRISGRLFAGVEAVGEDLEGFWEADEAEGGAKLLVGPSLNFNPVTSRLSFSLCGGPVFYATHSSVVPSAALRDVGSFAGQNGYSVRAQVAFNLR